MDSYVADAYNSRYFDTTYKQWVVADSLIFTNYTLLEPNIFQTATIFEHVKIYYDYQNEDRKLLTSQYSTHEEIVSFPLHNSSRCHINLLLKHKITKTIKIGIHTTQLSHSIQKKTIPQKLTWQICIYEWFTFDDGPNAYKESLSSY